MFFRFSRARDTLPFAVRAAIAAHDPRRLRELLESHGESAFAAALSNRSGRVIADALSMLPKQDNERVLRQLPAQARTRLGSTARADQRAAHPQTGSSPMVGLLVWQQSRHA